MSNRPGELFIVATPIGNLADLSPRAQSTLAAVDAVLCEDTRHSGRLLQQFSIKTRLIALHDHNESSRIAVVLEKLQAGQSLALISDAGTPLISDPGFPLVRAVRAAGIRVTPIPGPSAIIAALSAAGLPTDRFVFEGFLPSKPSQRRVALQALNRESRTLVFYESPRRIAETLADIATILGQDRAIVIARELTKLHEEFIAGSAAELAAQLADDTVKGECVIVVAGSTQAAVSFDADTLLIALLKELPASKAAKVAAQLIDMPRAELYQRAMELQPGHSKQNG